MSSRMEEANISVRVWKLDDHLFLEESILAYLQEVYEEGYDIHPTRENARKLLLTGLLHALDGDPVLLAEDWAGQIAGWTCWIGMPSNLDLRYNTCIGMGTWVLPVYRRIGVSKLMHEVASKMAAEKGYLVVDRFVSLRGPGRTMLARAGWETFGNMMRRRL